MPEVGRLGVVQSKACLCGLEKEGHWWNVCSVVERWGGRNSCGLVVSVWVNVLKCLFYKVYLLLFMYVYGCLMHGETRC